VCPKERQSATPTRSDRGRKDGRRHQQVDLGGKKVSAGVSPKEKKRKRGNTKNQRQERSKTGHERLKKAKSSTKFQGASRDSL